MINEWTYVMLDTQEEVPEKTVCAQLSFYEVERWTILSIEGGGFSPSGRFVRVWMKRCMICKGTGTYTEHKVTYSCTCGAKP